MCFMPCTSWNRFTDYDRLSPRLLDGCHYLRQTRVYIQARRLRFSYASLIIGQILTLHPTRAIIDSEENEDVNW